MNKEQAEIYVKNSINLFSDNSKAVCYYFLFINLAFLGIAIALYRELIFIIITLTIAVFNFILTIIFAKKKQNYINLLILSTMQLTVFCVVLNCLVFGIYKLTEGFILWEFLVSIAIQILAFGVSYILVKKSTFKYSEKQVNFRRKVLAGTTAGLSYSLALILCRIFSPSLQAGIVIIAILINLLVCLISLGIVTALHRIYLIKFYDLIDLGRITINKSDGIGKAPKY